MSAIHKGRLKIVLPSSSVTKALTTFKGCSWDAKSLEPRISKFLKNVNSTLHVLPFLVVMLIDSTESGFGCVEGFDKTTLSPKSFFLPGR